MGLGMKMGCKGCEGGEMGCVREMADALWERHKLLKTGVRRDRQTDRHIKLKNSISAIFAPFTCRIEFIGKSVIHDVIVFQAV